MRTTVSSPKQLKTGLPSSSSFTWSTCCSPVDMPESSPNSFGNYHDILFGPNPTSSVVREMLSHSPLLIYIYLRILCVHIPCVSTLSLSLTYSHTHTHISPLPLHRNIPRFFTKTNQLSLRF